jgi:hypothetical protein
VRAYPTRVEDGVISVELPVPTPPALKDDSSEHKLEPVTSGEVA